LLADYAATDCRSWFDYFKAHIIASTQQKLLPAQVGWWGFMYHSLSSYATTPGPPAAFYSTCSMFAMFSSKRFSVFTKTFLVSRLTWRCCSDELEYMAARGAAYDAAPSIETGSMMLAGNGRAVEALGKIRAYLELELPDAVKAQMRQPNMDFLLSENASGYWITPARSHPPRAVDALDPDSWGWSIPTAFPGEPARGRTFGVRVRALAAMDTDRNHATDLLMVNAPIHRDATRMVVSVDTLAPGAALKMAIATDCASECVASMTQRYAAPLDLSGYRQLSVRVKGDGSGTLLAVQLQTAANEHRDWFLELDFTGWKTVNLLVPAGRALFEHRGGRIPTNVAMSMRGFAWTAIAALHFYVTAAPTTGGAVVILVSGLLARKELPGVIGGGSIQIGDSTLALPKGVLHGSGCNNRTLACNVPPCNVSGCNDYLECGYNLSDSNRMCRRLDANGYPLEPSTGSLSVRTDNCPRRSGAVKRH
jgi:hypothetical protein